MRRNRRLIFQQNARQYLQSAVNLNLRESSDAIRQNSWQMRNLLESRLTFEQAVAAVNTELSEGGRGAYREMHTFDLEKRHFHKG